MPINSNYNEEAIVEAIATALDNFYTNLISNIDKLNIKKVMKRKNPYLFRAKAMNGAAQIIDAILAAFVYGKLIIDYCSIITFFFGMIFLFSSIRLLKWFCSK